MNTKTFIITATIIIPFLLKPFTITNNGNESEVITNTHSVELVYDCNTGYFGATITFNPFIGEFQKTQIRNSYIPYGLYTNLTLHLIANPNVEHWTFNLDNMNPGLIPPGTTCKTGVIIDKLEEDKDDGEIEEVEYDSTNGDH